MPIPLKNPSNGWGIFVKWPIIKEHIINKNPIGNSSFNKFCFLILVVVLYLGFSVWLSRKAKITTILNYPNAFNDLFLLYFKEINILLKITCRIRKVLNNNKDFYQYINYMLLLLSIFLLILVLCFTGEKHFLKQHTMCFFTDIVFVKCII